MTGTFLREQGPASPPTPPPRASAGGENAGSHLFNVVHAHKHCPSTGRLTYGLRCAPPAPGPQVAGVNICQTEPRVRFCSFRDPIDVPVLLSPLAQKPVPG